MKYLLIYPDGKLRQTSQITQQDTEEAKVLGSNRMGFVQGVAFYKLQDDRYVGVDWWEDVPWLPRVPVIDSTDRRGTMRPRGKIELWLDKHNHKMELLRTLSSVIAAIMGILVFLKVFGLI